MRNYIGWLSPSGELVECNGYAHLDMARKITKELHIYNEDEQADDTLLRYGWVRISRLVLVDKGITFWLPLRITPYQRSFLRDLAEDTNETISETGQQILLELGI